MNGTGTGRAAGEPGVGEGERGAGGPEESPPAMLVRDAAEFQRTILLLLRFYQSRGRGRIEVPGVSVSGTYALDILMQLGPITIGQLATELFVEKSTASRIVAGLEERGYVRRVTDRADRRAVRVEVTEAGRALHEEIYGEALRETAAVLGSFTGEARRAVIEPLQQIARVSASRAGFVDASCCRLPREGESLPDGLELRTAGPGDLEEALAVLALENLPTLGVGEHFLEGFVVARDPKTGVLAGVVGIEREGADGLLRSLAVRPAYRGKGLGRALARAAVELARVVGIHTLYLTAPKGREFRADEGWEAVPVEALPAPLRASSQVRALGPENVTVLRLRLG